MKLFIKAYRFGFKRLFLLLMTNFMLWLKIFLYRFIFSDNYVVLRDSKIIQPAQFVGQGCIKLKNVCLGVRPSPYLFNGVSYIEARDKDASIEIGVGTIINNNAVIIADRSQITIGKNCLIGANVFITDSDFHGLGKDDRRNGNYKCHPVFIGDNVFIANDVKILKGVTIGSNSVIGCGSVVVGDVPDNTLVAGVPANIIRYLND